MHASLLSMRPLINAALNVAFGGRRGMGSSKKAVIARYIRRQERDEYCKKARIESYRARSAFKLLQLQEKFQLMKPGRSVIRWGECND